MSKDRDAKPHSGEHHSPDGDGQSEPVFKTGIRLERGQAGTHACASVWVRQASSTSGRDRGKSRARQTLITEPSKRHKKNSQLLPNTRILYETMEAESKIEMTVALTLNMEQKRGGADQRGGAV